MLIEQARISNEAEYDYSCFLALLSALEPAGKAVKGFTWKLSTVRISLFNATRMNGIVGYQLWKMTTHTRRETWTFSTLTDNGV